MSSITVDSTVQKLLSAVTDITELRDKDGNVLGLFTPRDKTEEGVLRKLFDLNQARDILARETGQGRPLKEIWAEAEATERRQ